MVAERGARILPLPLNAAARTDDASLVRDLREARPGAARLLWTKFAPMVHRLLRRQLGPRNEVEDVVQDVFLCVFQKIRELRDPQALRSFIVSVTLLTARSQLRRRWVERWLHFGGDAELAREPADMTSDPEAREALMRFYSVLDNLTPGARQVFVLRFVEEWEWTDIASALELSVSTVKRQASRAWSRVSVFVERDPALAPFLNHEERS